jgi:hypothetical protein
MPSEFSKQRVIVLVSVCFTYVNCVEIQAGWRACFACTYICYICIVKLVCLFRCFCAYHTWNLVRERVFQKS